MGLPRPTTPANIHRLLADEKWDRADTVLQSVMFQKETGETKTIHDEMLKTTSPGVLGLLTASFAPFGRSVRVTHADE